MHLSICVSHTLHSLGYQDHAPHPGRGCGQIVFCMPILGHLHGRSGQGSGRSASAPMTPPPVYFATPLFLRSMPPPLCSAATSTSPRLQGAPWWGRICYKAATNNVQICVHCLCCIPLSPCFSALQKLHVCALSI